MSYLYGHREGVMMNSLIHESLFPSTPQANMKNPPILDTYYFRCLIQASMVPSRSLPISAIVDLPETTISVHLLYVIFVGQSFCQTSTNEYMNPWSPLARMPPGWIFWNFRWTCTVHSLNHPMHLYIFCYGLWTTYTAWHSHLLCLWFFFVFEYPYHQDSKRPLLGEIKFR